MEVLRSEMESEALWNDSFVTGVLKSEITKLNYAVGKIQPDPVFINHRDCSRIFAKSTPMICTLGCSRSGDHAGNKADPLWDHRLQWNYDCFFSYSIQ